MSNFKATAVVPFYVILSSIFRPFTCHSPLYTSLKFPPPSLFCTLMSEMTVIVFVGTISIVAGSIAITGGFSSSSFLSLFLLLNTKKTIMPAIIDNAAIPPITPPIIALVLLDDYSFIIIEKLSTLPFHQVEQRL